MLGAMMRCMLVDPKMETFIELLDWMLLLPCSRCIHRCDQCGVDENTLALKHLYVEDNTFPEHSFLGTATWPSSNVTCNLLSTPASQFFCIQDLEQARVEAQAARQQAEEQHILAQRAQDEAQQAQRSITLLQQQVAEASSSLSSATAAWDAERASLENAVAAAGEMASAEEVQRRVQAGIAGRQP